jgi:hypothetical protein
VYAAAAKAAEEAGQVARAVLEEQGRLAVVRLERWDPASGQWRTPGDPAEHDDDPGPGRLRRGAKVVLRVAAEALIWA